MNSSVTPNGHYFAIICRMARGVAVLVCLLLLTIIGVICGQDEVTQCIDGPWHKDKPSPEGSGYVECLSWKDKSCCTAEFTQELQRNKVEVLYNFSWNHCNTLSQVSFYRQSQIDFTMLCSVFIT